MKKIPLYFSFIFAYIFSFSQNSEITLNEKWQFRQKNTETWHTASVPGTIHTDLFANKLIPDPFFSDNEKNMQWIENEDWEYRTVFNCDKSIFQNNNIELKFEGLDTYAKVFLNDVLILQADNMFRSWTLDVKKILKETENKILIVFESSAKRGKREADGLNYVLPGGEKVFARKAQYQYGWDFGPRFVSCGIGKQVKLLAWKNIKIKSVEYYIPQFRKDTLKANFIVQTICDTPGEYLFDFTVNCDSNTSKKCLSYNKIKPILLKKGVNTDTLSLTIINPELWWYSGMGKASLYKFSLHIAHKNSILARSALLFGIRQIELIREKDFFGSSFYFKLNGVPVFMKGANYIPQDMFLHRVNKNAYQEIVSRAKQQNMNMLRVWGGGVYADDEFYSHCDQNGILVWQDFMFACAMYPGDSAFISNVKAEAAEQVQRLRNHPSIALWCGNNEIDEGWKNWGWQKEFKYAKEDSVQIWNNYTELFHKILPEIVKQNAAQANYWPSSPSIGWGHKESLLQGDSHYWGVWWGMEPFSSYEKKVGRFMSEYGFQAMPSPETFKSFCNSDELSLASSSVKAHQKHPAGYQTIQAYLERDYKTPKDFEKYIYVSQLLQRDGMKTAIEAHRRFKPYCMGTLFWQFNDCWPVTSWSALDYYNRPKAFCHELPRLYNNLLISIHKEREKYNIYIISDTTAELGGTLTLKLQNIKGETILTFQKTLKVLAQSANIHFSLTEKELEKINKKEAYLSCKFISESGNAQADNNYFFAKPREMALLKPRIELALSKDKYSFTVTSDVFVKDLFFFSPQPGLNFSANFIDLEPKKSINIRLNQPLSLKQTIKYFSLFDINITSN